MLWSSHSDKNLDDRAMEFSTSLPFDINLFKFDIEVNRAHSNMLKSIKIITSDENEKIQSGLSTIESNFQDGRWKPDVKEYEDIHSAIEDVP